MKRLRRLGVHSLYFNRFNRGYLMFPGFVPYRMATRRLTAGRL
jgi:hypothetical protein